MFYNYVFLQILSGISQVDPVRGRRLIRSSSDPSIATGENVPGIPPYPDPPVYQRGGRGDPRNHGPQVLLTIRSI